MQTEQLIIVGLAADMCVMLTATDARMLGYKVWVPSDCTAAESEHRKTEALRQLHEVFKCAVRPAERAAFLWPRSPTCCTAFGPSTTARWAT